MGIREGERRSGEEEVAAEEAEKLAEEVVVSMVCGEEEVK